MHEIDRLLAALGRAPASTEAFESAALRAARVQLHAEFGAAPNRSRGKRRPLGRRSKRLVVVMGLLVLVTVVLLAVPPREPSSRHGGGGAFFGVTPATAQELLHRAARALVQVTWHPLDPGRWLHYHVDAGYPLPNGRASHRPSFVEDVWLTADGAARVVQASDHDVILIGPARRALQQERALQRRSTQYAVVTGAGPWPPSDGLSYEQVIRIPSRAPMLSTWLAAQARRQGESGPAGTLVVIQMLLSDPRLPPQVAAAMYRILGQLPDVRLTGVQQDPLGRTGPTIGYEVSNDTETRIVFDPRSGRTLTIEQVSLGHNPADPPRGTLESWQAISRVTVGTTDH